MNIIDVYNEVRQQLLSIGLNIYKEVKPSSEVGNCLVLNSIPLNKNNYESYVDLIVILYLKKKNSEFDGKSAGAIFPQIEGGVHEFTGDTGFVTVTSIKEGNTINLDDSYTTTEFIFKIIIHQK